MVKSMLFAKPLALDEIFEREFNPFALVLSIPIPRIFAECYLIDSFMNLLVCCSDATFIFSTF